MKFLVETSLNNFLTQVENGDIRVSYLGEGMDRIAYYIEEGEYSGYVLKIDKSEDSDYGFFVDDLLSDFSQYEAGDQTGHEFQAFQEVYENTSPEEWDLISEVFCVPFLYDRENNAQIVDAVDQFPNQHHFYVGEGIGDIAEVANMGELEVQQIFKRVENLSYALIERNAFAGILSFKGEDEVIKVAEALNIFESCVETSVSDLHYGNIGVSNNGVRIIDVGILGDW